MIAASDPMRRMLDYATPMAGDNDLAGLRQLLDGIKADTEQLAGQLVEASYAESLDGRYRAARTAALMAFTLEPKNMEVRRQLAARLRTTNDAPLLLQLIRTSGPRARAPIPLLLSYAAQLSYLNLQEQALDYLDEARRGDPDYPPTLVSRGQVLTYLGRTKEAQAEFERCIAKAPFIGQAHWYLSHIIKATPEANRVARLRTAMLRPDLPAREQASFAFALHKELDDLGDYEGAWQALAQACQAKRASLTYSIDDTRGLVDALLALPSPTAAPTEIPQTTHATTPIFIVGMHRSGTTLLEQLLDASPQILGIGELYDFTSAMRYATDHHCRGVLDQTLINRASAVDYAALGQRYLDGVAWRLGESRFFTDKLPSNFLNIGFICQALPQAKILHLCRDPMETCFSNLRELFSDANAYSYDQNELGDYFIQYRRLMSHWHTRYPERILDVDYAQLTREPARVIQDVAKFCGVDYVDAMSDPRNSTRAVATASAVQIRQGVTYQKTPKWLPYAQHLQPLIKVLRDAGIKIAASDN